MVIRAIVIILSVIGFTSCDSKVEIVYRYREIVINRVDKNGKTIFYYGEINKDNPRIWVEYSGINDGFSGYLKFDESGKVSILSGDGYFQSANDDTTKFLYKDILAHERPELAENVYFIQNATRYEQEKNKKTNTKVVVIYPDND
jgi:hypothetical protein